MNEKDCLDNSIIGFDFRVARMPFLVASQPPSPLQLQELPLRFGMRELLNSELSFSRFNVKEDHIISDSYDIGKR